MCTPRTMINCRVLQPRMVFAFKWFALFFFSVPYWELLSLLAAITPTRATIVTTYKNTQLDYSWLTMRRDLPCKKWIFSLSQMDSSPIYFCFNLLAASYGLPLVFLLPLKSVFRSDVAASLLIPLVFLDRNWTHWLTLFLAVVSPAQFNLSISSVISFFDPRGRG